MSGQRSSAGALAVGFAGWFVLLVALCGVSLFQTATVGRIDAAAVAPAAALLTAVVLIVSVGIPKASELASAGWTRIAAAAAAGGVLGATPLIILANRYTSAPSGSVVIFWTTAFTGLAVLAASFATTRARGDLARLAAGLAGAAGAAGVLANWERPSSFSLLALFRDEQLSLAAAGIIWAVAFVALVSLARARGARPILGAAAAGSLVGAIAIGLSNPSAAAGSLTSSSVLAHAVAYAVAMTVALVLAFRAGAHVSASALFAVPTALTLLTYVENLVGAFGPRPVLIGPVIWSSAVALVCILLIVRSVEEGPRVAPPREGTRLLGLAFALAATAAGAVSLLSAGVDVDVRGMRTDMAAFTAKFAMDGVETVGGWLALSLALILLAEWLLPLRPKMSRAAGTITAAVVIALAWSVLHYVPLHTWVTWIPSEVQQDYGTEYASIAFSPVSTVWQVIAVIGALVAAALLLMYAVTPFGKKPTKDADMEGRTE